MKKKIMAVLATIAAVLGFGFAANTAMADEYGATGVVSGSVATVTFTGLTPGAKYYVVADDTVVENVTAAALKTWGPFTADADGNVKVKITLKAGAKTDVKIASDSNGANILASYTVSAPATGNGAATTADTGASVAPYAVAVVLLAAAGVALFAVRKTSVR